MEIIQPIGDILLQFVEKVFGHFNKSLGEEFDFCRFEDALTAELNALGCEILKSALEALDEYLLEHPMERDGWKVLRGPEPKSILTNLGEVVYNRRYYKNQETGKHRYIVDHISGIGPREHVAPSLKATLVARAVKMPYSMAAEGTLVTKQTVHNVLKKIKVENEEINNELTEKKVVKTLYIEADEDHVALQNGKKLILPIVYIHEGWRQENTRRRLINPFYISGEEDTEELWYSALDYIYNHYDFEQIEQIFIGGDGASWIKKGTTIINKSHYVLDRFHLIKYLKRASLRDDDVFNTLQELVYECNWDVLNKVLVALIEGAQSEQDKEKVKKCLQYIKNNRDGIEAYKKFPEILGVSAEGHVSHILADRISSRPKGWSIIGVNIIAKLRTLLANGVDIRKIVMQGLKHNDKNLKDEPKEKHKYQKTKKERGFKEKYGDYFGGSMPSLRGTNSSLTKALRSLAWANGF